MPRIIFLNPFYSSDDSHKKKKPHRIFYNLTIHLVFTSKELSSVSGPERTFWRLGHEIFQGNSLHAQSHRVGLRHLGPDGKKLPARQQTCYLQPSCVRQGDPGESPAPTSVNEGVGLSEFCPFQLQNYPPWFFVTCQGRNGKTATVVSFETTKWSSKFRERRRQERRFPQAVGSGPRLPARWGQNSLAGERSE